MSQSCTNSNNTQFTLPYSSTFFHS